MDLQHCHKPKKPAANLKLDQAVTSVAVIVKKNQK